MATVLMLLMSASVTPPIIRPTSWTASDDFNWDSSIDVPKGPGSGRGSLVIPAMVDGIVLSCNASYPIEWTFHHSQLPSHAVQRSSRGRWYITISTTRRSTDLNDPASFEYIADLRLMGSSNGITGNYTCQRVGEESLSRSLYVYWEATSPPFLIQQGQNATAVLDPRTKIVVLLCTVARPDIQVKLCKGTMNGTMSWTELKPNASILYNPKRGFTLINLPDPLGPYKCIGNSDVKDTTLVYVIPSTSPEAKPLEFGDAVKIPARFGFDPKTLQLYCCSRSPSPAPIMMHFYCDHPITCKNRKNALLYMENTSTRNGSCSSLRLFTQIAGIFRCFGDGINIVREYFFPMGTQYGFGGPMNRNRTPADPYFSWSKADPLKMIALRVWADKVYIGQNVTFGCQVSNYYFSKGSRWGIGYKNGTVVTIPEALRNTSAREMSQLFRRNIVSLVMTVDKDLASVGCYAPVWNTSDWKNQSISVNVLEPTKATFLSDPLTTVIDWYLNETEKYIECEATGDPIPMVSWTKDGKRFYKYQTKRTNQSSTNTVSRINITRVSYETHGDYTCTVKNFAGTASKTFKVVIHERTSFGIMATILVSVICLVMALGGVIFLVFRIKNQKALINKLAASSFHTVTSDPSTHVTPIDTGLTLGHDLVEAKQNERNYHRM